MRKEKNLRDSALSYECNKRGDDSDGPNYPDRLGLLS